MRIGINGRFLLARRTGVQRVAYNLIKHIIKLDQGNEYVIFTGEDYPRDRELEHKNVVMVYSPIRSGSTIRNHFWEQITLPRLANKHRVDILHNPANIGPLFYKGLSIINIHDLCFLVNPAWYSFSFQTLYKTIIPQISKNANKVITNSNNSKNDIYRYLKCTPEKVSMIYWSVEDLFLKAEKYIEPDFAYNNYILYVGSVEPRKNIGRLLRSYIHLRRKFPKLKTKLILIGCSNPVFRDEHFQIRDFVEDILFQGYVSDKQLVNFYHYAKLCIYPSLYEGFGLPPLEAMACGTPVITSNRASLPEVVADAAITINPESVEEMSEAMNRILMDDGLREQLCQKGKERLNAFSWQKASESTIRIYRQVYNKAKGNIFCG